MDKTARNGLLLLGGLLLLARATATQGHLTVLKSFLPSVEGFLKYPKWDVSQWSWGYGSRVPGSTNDRNKNPGGSITREQAWPAAVQFIQNDFQTLQPRITVPLTARQWAAILSFSYNLGVDDAKDLVPYINARDTAGLIAKMKRYIYADGEISDGLITRRQKETDLYRS